MNLNQITDPVGMILRFAAMGFAVAALAKVLGVAAISHGVMELAAVGIVCALAK